MSNVWRNQVELCICGDVYGEDGGSSYHSSSSMLLSKTERARNGLLTHGLYPLAEAESLGGVALDLVHAISSFCIVLIAYANG